VRVWEEVPGGTVITPGNLWLSSVTADAWRGRTLTLDALGTYASRAFTLDLGTHARAWRDRVARAFRCASRVFRDGPILRCR
jgi:hypothetical protein